MKMKFPRSAHNWITLIGVTIALIALSMIVFLFVISSVLNEGHVYLGLILYVALPAVMIFGLLLIPLGMYLQKKREKREGQSDGTEWPRIDFNIDRHRNAFFVFTVGTSILLFLSAIGSYEAFHFSE
ncbi:MAG TPA: cytochrome C, partial [Calditrichia bacterium]|nr:cytochrome C [Calditrichia bacterium]